MTRSTLACAALLSVALVRPEQAAQYSAVRSGDVIRLEDASSGIAVSIIPSVGNIAFEMNVKGRNILHWPYRSIEEFKARPSQTGIPLLAPWANRLDEQAFYANGKRYAFDMELGNVRGPRPIHGFLSTTDRWQLVDANADGESSWAAGRLEFFKQPLWMKQFPFAHTIEMIHRLREGALQVTTRIHNQSAEAMPIAVGFHPCFELRDSPRDEWTISIGARTRWLLAPTKIPTGETEPIEQMFPDPRKAPLHDYNLDDVFGDLVRDDRGRATASVMGKSQHVDVLVDPNWRALVVFAPKPADDPKADRNFICIEPMAGITDSMNLAHRGLYKELQSVRPGDTWEASFWVKPGGF